MRKFNTTGPCFPDEHYMLPKGDMFAIYCTLETLQNATDVDDTMVKIVKLLRRGALAVPALADLLGDPNTALTISQEPGWTVRRTALSATY